MNYLYKDYILEKAPWGHKVRIKTIRLSCKVIGAYGEDELFIRLNKSTHFPSGGIIRVLDTEVVK